MEVICVLILTIGVVRGWHAGIVLGGLGTLGLLLGMGVGLVAGPLLVSAVALLDASPQTRSVTLLTALLVPAIAGEITFVEWGVRVGLAARTRVTRRVDSVAGAVAALLAGSVALWMVGVAAKPVVPRSWAKAMNESHILTAIDRAMPPPAARWLTGATRSLTSDWFPRAFSGLNPEPVLPVEPPDTGQAAPQVAAAMSGVVKINADASVRCGQRAAGSGWVSAPQHVVTNAHVVAGSDRLSVREQGVGRELPATLVAFDPELDLAVLAVPELQAAPLPVGGELDRGDAATVAGFPKGGPLRAVSARVRGTVHATGDSIYGDKGATREVYAVYAEVEHGNSGGPLLDGSGAVVGTVFAKSLVDDHTGYVLTSRDTAGTIGRAATLSDAVSSGRCVPR